MNAIFWKTLVLFSVSPFILSGCSGQPKDEPTYFRHQQTDLSPDPGIVFGRLENGLRYAVMENATPSNTASLLMRIETGSINEADDERGIAHFLEHLAFNGSQNVPPNELIQRLERFGLAFGPDTNASTGFFDTTYQLELPEVNEDIINEGLFIMRETASNLLLDPKEIEKERGVILAEKRARNSPGQRASVAQIEYFFDGTLLPERMPIGTETHIQSVTQAQFRAFYNGYYRPENTFIVLVGDLDTSYASERIAHFFSDWTPVGEPAKPHEINTLGPRSAEAVYYADSEIQTSISINVIGTPQIRDDTQKNRELSYIDALGNRILSRRLSQVAQTTGSPFISAGASTSTAFDAVQMSSLSLSSQPERWADALAVGEKELRRAYLFGFTEAELDEQIANTRQTLKVSVDRAETRRTPSLARGIMGSIASDYVMTSPEFNLELFDEYADSITPERVHNAFKNHWEGYEEPQIYVSTALAIPDANSSIMAAYRNSQSVEVEKNAEKEKVDFAYSEFGPAGAVKSRATVEDLDFEQLVFENGVRLNLKQTDFQKGTISIDIAYGKGELFLPENGQGLRWLLGNAMSMGGLKAHSADELTSIMAGKTVGAGHNMGTRQMFMSGRTTQDDLRTQMNLMMAYYLEPGFREEAKARYDKWINSFYPTIDSTPSGVASRDLERLIRNNNPRFGIPQEKTLRDTTLEQVSNWLSVTKREQVIEIGVVGDFDKEAVIAEIARTFGTLPQVEEAAPVAPPEMIKLEFAEGGGRPITLTHAGEKNTALLRVYWPSPDGRDDMVLRRVNVLRAMFKIRMTDVLREELGASYSPTAFNTAPRTYPNFGYFAASLEINPFDIAKAEARIHALAEEFRAGDIETDLFERAISPIRESIEETLESNAYWMNIISRSQTDPEIVDRHRRRDAAYREMTFEDVIAVAPSIFDRSDAVVYHIVPEP